jgi:ribosome-associated heat shock protein Hsp15
MRIDLLLKYFCLVKSRSIAKNLCEKGAVLLGGRAVRPSTTVREGDRVAITKGGGTLEIEVLRIPEKQLSRTSAPDYYTRIQWASSAETDLDI